MSPNLVRYYRPVAGVEEYQVGNKTHSLTKVLSNKPSPQSLATPKEHRVMESPKVLKPRGCNIITLVKSLRMTNQIKPSNIVTRKSTNL